MKEKRSERWVGIFVVIGIILLVLMTMKIEKFQIGEKAGYLFHTYFDSVPGLDRNSPIRVAGVKVGNVEGIALEQGKAKVTFRVPKNIDLYQDAKAYIKSEGFLGEKYIEVTPGTPGYPKLEPNGLVEQGAPPVDVEKLLSQIGSIGNDIKGVTQPLQEVMKAIDAKKVDKMVDNFNKFSGQLTGLTQDSKETIQSVKNAFSRFEEIGEKVEKGEGTLGKLITDDTIYQDAKETVETVKVAVESAKDAVDTLKDMSDKIERGEGTLGKLINDESIYQEVKETVQSAKATMKSADETLQSVKGIAEKVEKGEGTLGKLITDDQVIKEADKTMKKIQRAAEGLEEQTPVTVLGTILGLFF